MLRALAIVAVVSFLVCYGIWGIQPGLRARRKRMIRRTERVRFASDVNTVLSGYQVRPNHWNVWIWTLFLLVWTFLIKNGDNLLYWMGSLYYFVLMWRRSYRNKPFQKIQSFLLTESGVWLFPERMGLPLWQGSHKQFCAWSEIDGYKVDGSFFQFFREEHMVLQVEFAYMDFEHLHGVLAELNVQRLELSDRVWVAQFKEEAFYKLEEEIGQNAWRLLGLFDDEFVRLGLVPEFGVMRNLPSNRLIDEHARSWLQLNLLDQDTNERKASSMFPLWQSNGSVGFLIGVRGQEIIERLQQWIQQVIEEAETSQKEAVS